MAVALRLRARVIRRGRITAETIPLSGTRIRANPARFDDGALRITIDPEFGGDHTVWRDTFLHPLLERRVETVLGSVAWPQPLAEVVGLVAASAVSHPWENIELQETVDCGISHSPAHIRNELDICLGAIVSAVIDDDLAATLLERRKISADESLEPKVCRRRSRHDSIVVRWIALRFHESLPAAV